MKKYKCSKCAPWAQPCICEKHILADMNFCPVDGLMVEWEIIEEDRKEVKEEVKK